MILHGRLEQSNISKGNSWKIWHLLYSTRSWGKEPRLCVRVFIWHLGHEQEPEIALRRDGWFSHMGNSVWLHWGTRKYLNKQCTVNWAKWCAWPMAWRPGGWRMSSARCGSRGTPEIRSPTSSIPVRNANNVHTFHMNAYIIGPAAVLPEGRVCGVACRGSVVFPAARCCYLLGPPKGNLSNGWSWPWPMAVTY